MSQRSFQLCRMNNFHFSMSTKLHHNNRIIPQSAECYIYFSGSLEWKNFVHCHRKFTKEESMQCSIFWWLGAENEAFLFRQKPSTLKRKSFLDLNILVKGNKFMNYLRQKHKNWKLFGTIKIKKKGKSLQLGPHQVFFCWETNTKAKIHITITLFCRRSH